MEKISAIINTYNEAHLLRECIDSIKDFADEIIVGDMMSSDGSIELAKEMGCKVLSYPRKPIVEHTILTRLKNTSFDWILMFDPDNRLPAATAKRLKEVVINNEADVVQFYYKNKIFGKFITHGHASGGIHVRFFKKSILLKNGEPEIKIHSMIVEAMRKNTHRWIKLDKNYFLEHIAYDSIYKCFEQHLKYAEIEAIEKYNNGEQFSFIKMMSEVLKKFLIDFIYKSAWRDGINSIIYSLISELMILQTYLFLWEKKKKNEE